MCVHGTLTTPYHPKANGMVEHINGTLLSILQKLELGCPGEWSTFILSAIFTYSIAYHSATGRLPFMLLYGIQPDLLPVLYSCVSERNHRYVKSYFKNFSNTLIKLHHEAYFIFLAQNIKRHDRENQWHAPLSTFEVGEKVLYYN